jgi:hypothetical protein
MPVTPPQHPFSTRPMNAGGFGGSGFTPPNFLTNT